MAIKQVLKDRNNKIIYPVTDISCVNNAPNIKCEEYIGEVEKVIGVTREELKLDSLIDRWNSACSFQLGNDSKKVGEFDSSTGLFRLGHQYFTAAEAQKSLALYPIIVENNKFYNVFCYRVHAMPNVYFPTNTEIAAQYVACFCYDVRVIVVTSQQGHYVINNWNGSFARCDNLVEIIGKLRFGKNATNCTLFEYSPKVEIVEIVIANTNLDVSATPKLNYDSFNFLVENAKNTEPVTITIHEDIYNAMQGTASYPFNGGTAEQWSQLLTDATTKQITFAKL